MDRNSLYYRQVRLLVRLFPIIGQESCFALKGGTAINLFVRDLPRLSVDIDLVYLPLDDRETALRNARSALSRIAANIKKELPDSEVLTTHEASDALRLFVTQGDARIKIELSPVLRGSVFPPIAMDVRPIVEEEFGYGEMLVLSLPDLYAGKLCAALDRQHPRDLFDVKLLMENEGIDDDLRKTFLVYLISHHRPIAELIAPTRKDIRNIFEGEFARMTTIPVTVADLEETREKFIKTLRASLTKQEKAFLLSFKSREPDWPLLGLQDVENLPAVRWKLLNLQKMSEQKHQDAYVNLEKELLGR
ncbi:MAG: nucleotidyl transferase AbiEii/AbiGii toxin family protein [Alphaproteobacteria bacterium]